MRRDPHLPTTPPPPSCGVCGLPLDGDPDDEVLQPIGPMCGPCVRARAFDDTIWELDLSRDSEPW